jgi:hypothetical protein
VLRGEIADPAAVEQWIDANRSRMMMD